MSTYTELITQTPNVLSVTLDSGEKPASDASAYQIEEREPVNIPVPLGSPLAVAAHFATWTFWLLYLVLRLPREGESMTHWLWLLYFCEAAFVVQDFQTALELTFSLFGPRDFFQHAQYTLKGTRAPKVSVLVTVCGEELSTVMDTVAAAAVQHYPPEHFRVFVLDDAADQGLRKAIDDFNASSHQGKSKFQDVVYHSREKPVGKRHYYKSGNLRAGLELTASKYGASEFFAALDADMISEPDWLARTVPHLIKNENVALVSPPQISYNVLEDDKLCQDSNVYAQILEPFRDFLGCSQCSGSGYVMRRKALDSIGGWPLANIGEDLVCSNMLQEHGWDASYIPDQLQFGLAPDSFHGYVNQRIRWTYGSLLVGKRFGLVMQGLLQADGFTRSQRILSMMGALKAYTSTIAFIFIFCLPICFLALQTGEENGMLGRNGLRLAFFGQFVASNMTKRYVYGRLGSVNVANMTTSRLWTSPFNTFCTVKSLFYDPGETSFKVSGTFVSPTDERYPARRKPLTQRVLNPTMICYAGYSLAASVALASFSFFVAHQHLVVDAKRTHMYTGAALTLLDAILAALVPLQYMVWPPSLPDRRELLVKDEHGVYRSQKKEWKKRDGGSQLKFWLQIAIIGLYDWL